MELICYGSNLLCRCSLLFLAVLEHDFHVSVHYLTLFVTKLTNNRHGKRLRPQAALCLQQHPKPFPFAAPRQRHFMTVNKHLRLTVESV